MPQLEELLNEELRDLYDAEKQLTKALPKLARAASTQDLKQALLAHTDVTKNQLSRLEQAFEALGVRAKGKPCKAMKGLVEEAQEIVQEHEKGFLLDSAIIGACQKVEHYEIAGYGTVRAMAKSLGRREVQALLQETLKEEERTDKDLTTIALQIQKQMLRDEGMGGREDVRGGAGTRAKKKVAAGGGNARTAASTRGAAAKQTQAVRSGTRVTVDHDEIRNWAEERGAHPACVKGTGGKGDTGMIRLDFPGYSGGESLQEISWDEFFQKFDESSLALLFQETTRGGQKSNFNKLVARETAELAAEGGTGSARRASGRKAAGSRR